MGKPVRVAVVIVLCALVAVPALGVLLYQRQQRLLKESPFFQELDALVQREDFAAVSERLVEKARTADKGESRLVTVWLKRHASTGTFPALYFMSLFYTTQGRLGEAGRWYSAAALVARIDAARCGDATASGALAPIEALFTKTKAYLAARPKDRKSAASWALEYEEKTRDRPLANWICRHGIKTFSGDQKPQSAADWQAARDRIRAEFQRSFAQD